MDSRINSSKKIIIAIDGYSSSGKSTMARTLARHLGYTYIDSGAMYRAVTLYALDHGLVVNNTPCTERLVNVLDDIIITFSEEQRDGTRHTIMNGNDVENEIRSLRVSQAVSQVAAIPQVRHRLVALQQDMGKNKGIVMDGRDIGTAVFPQAELKVFVSATPEVRAMRRLKEMQAKGLTQSYDEILNNIRQRDRLDLTRSESPLRQAPDAVLLDNDTMTREEQLSVLLDLYNQCINA